MANYSTLKSAIQAVIKTNGTNAITGAKLQEQLLSMVTSLGTGYQFMGIATQSTNPGTPDQKVFYIAAAGTYNRFNNLTIPANYIGVFKWDSSWSVESISIATAIADGSVTRAKLDSFLVNDIFRTGYVFNGFASPSDGAWDLTRNIWLFASEPGVYTNYVDFLGTPIVISESDGLCVLTGYYTGTTYEWTKFPVPIHNG